MDLKRKIPAHEDTLFKGINIRGLDGLAGQR